MHYPLTLKYPYEHLVHPDAAVQVTQLSAQATHFPFLTIAPVAHPQVLPINTKPAGQVGAVHKAPPFSLIKPSAQVLQAAALFFSHR